MSLKMRQPAALTLPSGAADEADQMYFWMSAAVGTPGKLRPLERASDCNEGFRSVKQFLKYLTGISCSTERQLHELVYSMEFTLKLTCI